MIDYIIDLKDYLVKKMYDFFGYNYIYVDYNNIKMIEYKITDEEINKEIENCTKEINDQRIKDIEYTFFCLDMETRYNNLNKDDNNQNNNNGSEGLLVKRKVKNYSNY